MRRQRPAIVGDVHLVQQRADSVAEIDQRLCHFPCSSYPNDARLLEKSKRVELPSETG